MSRSILSLPLNISEVKDEKRMMEGEAGAGSTFTHVLFFTPAIAEVGVLEVLRIVVVLHRRSTVLLGWILAKSQRQSKRNGKEGVGEGRYLKGGDGEEGARESKGEVRTRVRVRVRLRVRQNKRNEGRNNWDGCDGKDDEERAGERR